jgi:hypothetical protein
MLSSEMWYRVLLVRTDVSEERVAYIFKEGKIHERRKALAVEQLAVTRPTKKNKKTNSMV